METSYFKDVHISAYRNTRSVCISIFLKKWYKMPLFAVEHQKQNKFPLASMKVISILSLAALLLALPVVIAQTVEPDTTTTTADSSE